MHQPGPKWAHSLNSKLQLVLAFLDVLILAAELGAERSPYSTTRRELHDGAPIRGRREARGGSVPGNISGTLLGTYITHSLTLLYQ